MEDIAHIGFKSDSEDLVTTKKRLEDIQPAADKAEKASDKLKRRMRELSGESDAVGGRLGALMNRIRAFGFAIGAALSIRQLANYADAWSDMQSRIGAAIGDMDAAPAVMREMVRLANASYSPLEQTVESFGRNVAVLRELGLTTQQQLNYTEALNHALVITATRGERAASVQAALSRSMAVGTMGAEQLETVLVNGGRVAEALAEELGTTVSGLRQMASDGRITGAVIASALTNRLDEFRDAAAEMPATIADAWVRIQTNTTALIGTLDQMTGTSGNVAAVILLFADNLHMVAGFAAAAGIAIAITYVPAIWGAVTATGAWIAATVTLRGALIATGVGAFIVIAGTLIGTLIDLARKTGSFATAIELLGQVARGVWAGIVQSAEGIPLGLRAVWATVEVGFRELVISLVGIWTGFLQYLASSIGGIQTPFGDVDFAEMMGLDEAIASAEAFANVQNGAMQMAEWRGGVFGRLSGEQVAAGFDTARESLALLNVELETLDNAGGGTGTAVATPDANGGGGGASARVTELQRLGEAYSQLLEPINQATAAFDSLTEAKELGVINNDQYVAGLARIESAFLTAGGTAQQWAQIMRGAADDVGESLEDLAENSIKRLGDEIFNLALDGSANFEDLAKSVIKSMLQMMWQAMVVGPIMRMFGFAGGGTFGTDGGNVTPFAKGGTFTDQVFNRPTPFKFAQGGGFGLGVMGEAGPEAVMPLTRGPDGSLGVQMYQSGGGQGREQRVKLDIAVTGEAGPMLVPTIQATSHDAAVEVYEQREAGTINKSVGMTRKAMNKSKQGW